MNDICNRIDAINTRIRLAAHRVGRNAEEICLLAVSKTFAADTIRDAFACGQHIFGENYAEELSVKAVELADLDIEWHFIGRLQSNKTRHVASWAHWVHSIDRISIAERLSRQRPAHLPNLQVCLQVNISGEASKSGVAPEQLTNLARSVATLPNLELRGLMALPAPSSDLHIQQSTFAHVRRLRDQLVNQGLLLDTLSMGMSSDLEAAITEGATIVRIGSAIFGPRI